MLGSVTVANAAELPYYTKSKDILERDQQFVRSHDEGWNHGRSDLYTILTYVPSLSQATVLASKQISREIHFEPRISLAHMESYMRVPNESYFSDASEPQCKKMLSKDAEAFRSDPHALLFSGLLDVPAFSFCTGGVVALKRKPALFCYHTHFELGEITYMFGGLRCDPISNFKAMGIPKSTELSQISVHMLQELPPYVNRDVFLSPLMGFNYSFVTFNPTRGTVHEYPLASMQELAPSTICDMKGTQISEAQVFFCGGFHVNTDSVTYKPELNRWIVERSISLNTKGYVLDTRKLTFTKINIVAKLDMVFCGRVGGTLTSSYFASCSNRDDLSSANASEENAQLRDFAPAERQLVPESKQANGILKATSVQVELSAFPAARAGTRTPDNTPVSRVSSFSMSRPPSNPYVMTSPSESSKKPSLLSKSSRFFHRALSKKSNSSTQSSMYSLYSNQVKQHRSQSLPMCQTDSRPSSPHQLKISQAKLDVGTHLDSKDSDQTSILASATNIFSPIPETGKARANVHSPAVSVASECEDAFGLNENTKAEFISVCVYLFGGFQFGTDDLESNRFEATNKLLKIELLIEDAAQLKFHKSALMVDIPPNGDLVPLPRGFFAYFLTDSEGSDEPCEYFLQGIDSDNESAKLLDTGWELSSGQRPDSQNHKCWNGHVQLNSKRLIIHGGVNEKMQVFSDFFAYSFSTNTWQKLSTYAFDYFSKPKKPYEDENLDDLRYESQVPIAESKEAELRCCHHRASTYYEDGMIHVVLAGGFGNDYLRHFDPTPYTSDLLDVSRLSRHMLGTTNSNLLRIPALNLSTLTWKFSRYFYDLREVATAQAVNFLTDGYMKNSRILIVGGSFLAVGKQLTFCHGIALFVPEKSEDFLRMQSENGQSVILLGGHFHLTFPGM